MEKYIVDGNHGVTEKSNVFVLRFGFSLVADVS